MTYREVCYSSRNMTVYYTKLMLKYLREEEINKNAQREIDMVSTHITNSVVAEARRGIHKCSFSYIPHHSYEKYSQHLRLLDILETRFPDMTISMKTDEYDHKYRYKYVLEW